MTEETKKEKVAEKLATPVVEEETKKHESPKTGAKQVKEEPKVLAPVDPDAMIFYLTRRNISFQNDSRAMIPRNRLVRQHELKKPIELCKRGALVEVLFEDPINLDTVPSWRVNANRLKAVGITHVVQALYYSAKEISETLGVAERTVLEWQNELFQYLESLVREPDGG